MCASWKTARSYHPNDLAEIKFPECGAEVSFRLLHDVVVPRPVVLVSTISEATVNNVAPFSYISPIATTPAASVLSVLRRDDGSEKDSLRNLRASGELVINAVTAEIVEAANACAESLPATISEFEFAGLTPTFLSCRTPHVAQSPVRLECRVESETPIGGDGYGAASIVIVSVTRAYVSKAMYCGKGQINVAALRLIGSSSVDQYLVADGQFTISPITPKF